MYIFVCDRNRQFAYSLIEEEEDKILLKCYSVLARPHKIYCHINPCPLILVNSTRQLCTLK